MRIKGLSSKITGKNYKHINKPRLKAVKRFTREFYKYYKIIKPYNIRGVK